MVTGVNGISSLYGFGGTSGIGGAGALGGTSSQTIAQFVQGSRDQAEASSAAADAVIKTSNALSQDNIRANKEKSIAQLSSNAAQSIGTYVGQLRIS